MAMMPVLFTKTGLELAAWREKRLGDLACEVFRSLRPEDAAEDMRRMKRVLQTMWPDAAPSTSRWAGALALLRRLLTAWWETGEIRWTMNYSDLDPWDGPHEVLASPKDRQELDVVLGSIEWTLPPKPGVRGFRVHTPAALVWLSALEAIAAGTLRACPECRVLFTTGPGQGRKQRCLDCAGARSLRLSRPPLQRAYVLASDRLRKNHCLSDEQRNVRHREMRDLLSRVSAHQLTRQEAITLLEAEIAPKDPQGRGRPRKGESKR